MNCGDIDELAPLWHSGELGAVRQASFDEHVAGCPPCALELQRQSEADLQLRNSVGAERLDTRDLEQRVAKRISSERLRRWLLPSAAVAATVLAAVLLWTGTHAAKNGPAVIPAIFTDAVRDHTVEVIRQAPRHWRTEPAEITAIETSQGISDAEVKAVEATGYHLTRAKICRLGGLPYMHLVYSGTGREFSVYMRVKENKALRELSSSTGNLQFSSFARGRVQAVIVTGASAKECSQFAHDAEAALQPSAL